ncbi:hypothetical protein EfmAA610_09170 [Enterococcus faecium]|nr:hypothetical protein EfmAA610_09170 [Enterococcus faecium]
MDLKTFTAQIELMHQEALRQSVSYEDKWLNTFHGGRESAHVEGENLAIVRDFIGHGVGPTIHEEPAVPHYGEAGKGLRFRSPKAR